MKEKILKGFARVKRKLGRIPTVSLLFAGYAAIILTGTLLLLIPAASADGNGHGFLDCLFTATSATCVTGLVPFETGISWSLFGQIVIICLIQLGGLGFMTVITLFYIIFGKRIGIHDRSVLMKSQGAFSPADIIPLIRKICVLTFSTEGVGALVLFSRLYGRFGMKGLYYAVFTSISAFCNAGFDVFGTGSLTEFRSDPLFLCAISAIIIIGGLGFVVFSDLFANRFRLKKCLLHTKVVLLSNLILVFGGAVLFFILEFTDVGTKGAFTGFSVADKLANALFLSVSPRTAGFAAVDLSLLSGSGQFLTILLMFIGGNSCSTAGGVKVTTVLVTIANLSASARKAKEVKLLKNRVSNDTVRQASAILLSYLIMTVAGVLILGTFESAGLNQILFEVVSAAATVGLTMNLTPSLGTVSKIVIILLMYFGRLGVFSFFELIAGKAKKEYVSRPEGRIMVG